jgi:hypothetical protein
VRGEGNEASLRGVGWWFDTPRYAPFFEARVDSVIQD